MLRTLISFLLVFTSLSCTQRDVAPPIFGETMGTHYSEKFGQRLAPPVRENLQRQIDDDLESINATMSTWRDDSELSQFNAGESTEWVVVSAATAAVVSKAMTVSEATGGAFDITAAPLVELWGFGTELPQRARPAEQQLQTVMQQVGWDRLEVREEPPALRKMHPQLSVDLSAIAKGYAVDQMAARLSAAGVRDFLVEIGGELCARGVAPGGEPWVVAVAAADAGPPAALVRPGYRCVATSGDYQNFFELDGRRFSHVINPLTGWPVSNEVASVTVVADSAMDADAWATAFMVLGAARALDLAEQYGAAVLLLRRTPAGIVKERSSAFVPLEQRVTPAPR
ncbi:MAG: FAD:protein FMN transferase [Gammaproteobacteria bacterium]|nr:FAD:protein FMN transferase [Gammaproteobacteria bacterium]